MAATKPRAVALSSKPLFIPIQDRRTSHVVIRWRMEDGGWRREDGGWRMEDRG